MAGTNGKQRTHAEAVVDLTEAMIAYLEGLPDDVIDEALDLYDQDPSGGLVLALLASVQRNDRP
jgi:hypothetical protein